MDGVTGANSATDKMDSGNASGDDADAASVAAGGTVEEISSFLGSHPGLRDSVESGLVAHGRFSELAQLGLRNDAHGADTTSSRDRAPDGGTQGNTTRIAGDADGKAAGSSSTAPSTAGADPSSEQCRAAWTAANAEATKVDAIPDVRARNRAISADYAKLYLDSPDLKWAGAAAFASKQVGCGMDESHTYLDDYPGGPLRAMQNVAQEGGAIDPVTLTEFGARQALGDGNRAVYDELYPPLRVYDQLKGQQTGQEIMSCMDHKPGTPIDPSIRRGIEQTVDGHGEQGALTMLKHEQQDTLQSTVYDKSPAMRAGLFLNSLVGYPAVQLVVANQCTSSDPAKVVDFKNYPGKLYNFNDRWPFAIDSAQRFNSLAKAPETRGDVERALKEIANGTAAAKP